MWTANNPISHHTSHTLDNGASSSNNGIHGDGAHPFRHHTSHTLENGASSSNKGGIGDGKNSNESRSSHGSVVSLLFFIQDTIGAMSWKPP